MGRTSQNYISTIHHRVIKGLENIVIHRIALRNSPYRKQHVNDQWNAYTDKDIAEFRVTLLLLYQCQTPGQFLGVVRTNRTY